MQTQVAVDAGRSGGGRYALSGRPGGVEPFRVGVDAFDTARACREARFGGLGTIVTFGDDFMNPA